MEYLIAGLIVLIIGLAVGIAILADRYGKANDNIDLLRTEIAELMEQNDNLELRNSKIKSQKKSSEVRLGMITEKLAPFLDGFDYDPMNVVFLGRPVDYIHFGEDGITFVEVKSGKSSLSKRQRQIRDQIKDGNINWDEFKVN